MQCLLPTRRQRWRTKKSGIDGRRSARRASGQYSATAATQKNTSCRAINAVVVRGALKKRRPSAVVVVLRMIDDDLHSTRGSVLLGFRSSVVVPPPPVVVVVGRRRTMADRRRLRRCCYCSGRGACSSLHVVVVDIGAVLIATPREQASRWGNLGLTSNDLQAPRVSHAFRGRVWTAPLEDPEPMQAAFSQHS